MADEINNFNSDTFRVKSSKDVQNTIRDYILTHTNEINDFTEGSGIETLIEAISMELEQFYVLGTDNIKSGINEGIYEAFGFSPIVERKAYGSVLVDFGNALTAPVTIPRGTKFVSTNSSYTQEYQTLDNYVVPAGTTAYTVTVYCTKGGTFGNVPAGVINRVTNLGNVATVTNTTSITTGTDKEPLNETRRRFREFIQALQRGTVQAIKYGVMETPGIVGAYVDEEVGYVRVFCHDANGDLPTDLQKKAQANMIHWRSAGIPVEIFPMHKSVVDMNIILDVPNSTLQTSGLAQAIIAQISNYIDNHKAGEGLVHSEIINKILNVDEIGIENARADIMITPDNAIRSRDVVNPNNAIFLNEHSISKESLQPEVRSLTEGYIHNEEDFDDDDHVFPKVAEDKMLSDRDLSEDDLDDRSGNVSYTGITNGIEGIKVGFDNGIRKTAIYTYTGEELGNTDDVNSFQVTLDSSGSRIEYFVYTNPDNITIRLYASQSGVTPHAEIIDGNNAMISVPVVLNEPSKYRNLSFSVSENKFVVVNNTTGAVVTVNINGINIRREVNQTNFMFVDLKGLSNLDNNNISNVDDNTLAYTSDVTYGKQELNKMYNYSGKVISYTKSVTAIDGTKTVTNYNSVGSVNFIATYDRGNKLTSKVDGTGKNILKPDTDKQTDNSNNINNDNTGTTTDENGEIIYPFANVPVVTAQDAEKGSYVPVYNKYMAQGDEILRSGFINVYFRTSSVNN